MSVFGFVKNRQGFSIIELLVAITIIGLLTAIAVPVYRSSTQRSARTEGQGALMDAAFRMEKLFSDEASYNSATISDSGGATISQTTATGKYQLSFTLKTAETFTLQAAPQGGQSADACGTLSIDHLGIKLPKDCW